jgi:ATPase subunit of ABC transporter with duplicated ATPase domains
LTYEQFGTQQDHLFDGQGQQVLRQETCPQRTSISPSFYGAKIGVLGLNGSGKSSLLKIIAGVDKDINGEVVFSKGYSVGYLEQEPKLDESKTVQQIVEEAVQSTVDLLKEFEEINAKFAEPMDDDEMNAPHRTPGRGSGKT